MVETEIWPNLLRELVRAAVPAVLINGRISDKSFGKYKVARPFLKNILNEIDMFCMQSPTDAKRIRELGAPEDRVRTTGNMKFDIDTRGDEEKSKAMQKLLNLNSSEKLFVAGSTHKGEEEALVRAFKEVIREFPNLKLLIAPRHVERVAEVEALVRRFGLEPARVSNLYERRDTNDERRVFILDTIGQLNDIYPLATLVFIGGSLVRHGGHNPIEPAIFEKAILFGPHMSNFKDISSIFLKNEAAIQVADRKELLEKIKLLLNDDAERTKLGQNAKRVVLKSGGATRRNLDAIEEIIR
jgi:3-deoxy-D-manno-octulosonic-acid transferase